MWKYIYKKRNYLIEMVLDIFIFGGCYIIAYILRLDGEIPPETMGIMKTTVPFVILVRTLVFFKLKAFSGQWRYSSIADIVLIVKAISIGTLIIIPAVYLFNRFEYVPRTVFIIDWMLVIFMVGGVRFSRRLLKELLLVNTDNIKRVLIIGAGEVGTSLISEMKSNWDAGYYPAALIDDDPQKINQSFYGIKVHGNRMSIPHVVETLGIDEIIIALPHENGRNMREIVKLCRLTKKPYKIVTNSLNPTDQKNLKNRIRNINIQDLIGRRPIEIDYGKIEQFIEGKRVLVTGAAGSIGSELCRQIASFNPEKLIAFDQSENGLFYLDRELMENFQDLDYSPVLADITDFEETSYIFNQYKPHLVFHAAAYKHVPIMEFNPIQAIKNNIIGTKNVVDISIQNNVRKFVLISTDKAVNPTNFMGMSKKIAEQYVQSRNQEGATKCVAVRFGNVLGSSGSVIRIFEDQIYKGGPITVTHPDVARFFMTIPEAVQLVLQASNFGNGGEIFVLKMGELIKIYELAKEIILLAGKEPNVDIKIDFIGLRPGEKVIEELWEDNEECKEDYNENLYIIKNGDTTDLKDYQQKINEILNSSIRHRNDYKKLKLKLESIAKSVNSNNNGNSQQPEIKKAAILN
ncbi:NAD-dependent epimerase/dehydratase family protein [candidate division KSB1 bacterium]|nr:NAD-dependent epimerase/dehydratase family protein [candidate division KSB1 bacterium]